MREVSVGMVKRMIALWWILVPATASAQSAAPVPWRTYESAAFDAEFIKRSTPTFGNPTDYRWEGVIIGATAMGILGGVAGALLCSEESNNYSSECLGPTLGWTLMGATVGGVTGGLLGSLFPKRPRPL